MRMRAFLSSIVGDHQMADAKRKRVAGGEPEEGGYVRLTPSVAKFMGGKRYCKESELTLHTLLSHERSMGEISECAQLVRVTVTTLDGKTTTHTLDSEHHEVRDLKNHVGEKHGLECDAQNFSYAPTAGGTAKVSGDYLPDDELLKDGAALSLYVDKTQMERLEAVERSLAKRADQYGRKGFFCDCASLTKHERLVDAEMALFGKYSESTTHSSYTWRLEALETKTWDERLGQVRGLKAYTSWHPSSLIRMANPEWNPRFSYSRDQPILYPRTVVVDITTN